MDKYVCIKNCGFNFGEECIIENEFKDYIIIKNKYNERNVFTKEEFNKYFKKLVIKDVNHGKKFNKLKKELEKENNKKIEYDNNEKGYGYYHEKGNMYFSNKQYDKAIEYFKKDLDNKDTIIESYYNLGTSYFKLERYNESIEWLNIAYNKYKETNKPVYNILFNMGVCYAMLDNVDKALEYFYKCKYMNEYDDDCIKAIKTLEDRKTNNK